MTSHCSIGDALSKSINKTQYKLELKREPCLLWHSVKSNLTTQLNLYENFIKSFSNFEDPMFYNKTIEKFYIKFDIKVELGRNIRLKNIKNLLMKIEYFAIMSTGNQVEQHAVRKSSFLNDHLSTIHFILIKSFQSHSS
jgi:hypothetical protein